MTSTIARPDRDITAPGPLLYLTEPARAAVDFGLLTTSAPLLKDEQTRTAAPSSTDRRPPMPIGFRVVLDLTPSQ